jgi:hypothetical protein
MESDGLKIISVVRELEPHITIVWAGKSLETTAAHQWDAEPAGDDSRIITTESLNGWFPKILILFKPTFLDESLNHALWVKN